MGRGEKASRVKGGGRSGGEEKGMGHWKGYKRGETMERDEIWGRRKNCERENVERGEEWMGSGE